MRLRLRDGRVFGGAAAVVEIARRIWWAWPLWRRVGLGRGWRGWLFTLIVAAAPAFWLFPPPFVRNVILPMLTFIGAT